MLTNRSAPPVTVAPVLVYPDVHAAVAWLEAAFGFEERVRIGDAHRAQMRVGEDGAIAAGYSWNNRPWRELFRPVERPVRPSPYLKFFDEHSAWIFLLPLFLILGAGWVLRRYG